MGLAKRNGDITYLFKDVLDDMHLIAEGKVCSPNNCTMKTQLLLNLPELYGPLPCLMITYEEEIRGKKCCFAF